MNHMKQLMMFNIMKFDWYYERHPETTFESVMLEESFDDITEYKYLACKSRIDGNKIGYWRKFFKNPLMKHSNQPEEAEEYYDGELVDSAEY